MGRLSDVAGRFRSSEAREGGGAEAVGPADTRPLVLVLDDDVDYRERLAEELEDEGVKVEVTSEGNEGLREAIALQPELVMVGMSSAPEPEGLELPPRFREATPAPVLIQQDDPASGRGVEEAARAGAVACLSNAEVLPQTAAWKPIAVIAGRTFGEGVRESIVRKHISRPRVRFARAGLDARIDTAHAKGYRVMTTEGTLATGHGAW